MNQWHNYKEACLRSQEKLQQWLEKHLQSSPMVNICGVPLVDVSYMVRVIIVCTLFWFLQVVTIKDEPVDLDFCEDNIEVISETTIESDLVGIVIFGIECKGFDYILKAYYLPFPGVEYSRSQCKQCRKRYSYSRTNRRRSGRTERSASTDERYGCLFEA